MLQSLRDNSKGLVSGILIGFLVLIFAISGSESLFNRDPNAQVTIKVNGETISRLEVERAISNRRLQMQDRFGDSIPAEFLSDEHLRGPAIDSLIERALLVQAARDAGLTVPDDFLNTQILETQVFHDETGVFNPRRYQMVLSNYGYTPTTYKKVIGEDVTINQLSAGIVDTGFVTPAEVDAIVALNFQNRDFSYLVLPAASVRDSVEISEGDIQTYYEANPESFTHPEEVAVDYIELSVDKLMAGVDVSEDDLRQQYQQNLARFNAEPEYEVAHILIESGDAAQVAAVSEKLAAGESFESLAKTYSDDLGSRESGGDLGFTSGNTFPEAFEAALAPLAVGEVSGPITTDAGVHFIKKLSERGVEPPSFEEERDRIANQLQRARAESEYGGLLVRLRDLSYNAENLGEVAEQLGLDVVNTGRFSRFGGQGIAGERIFVEAAFGEDVIQDNLASEVLELSSNRVFVLKKTEHQPSFVRPLADVRETIETQLRNTRTQELLAQQAADIKARVAAGESLESIAAELELTLEVAQGVNRNDPDHDRQIVGHVFTMAKPAEGSLQVDSLPLPQGDYAVVSLTAVNPGGQDIPAEQKRVIAEQLSGINGQNEFRRFQAYLKDSAKIKR